MLSARDSRSKRLTSEPTTLIGRVSLSVFVGRKDRLKVRVFDALVKWNRTTSPAVTSSPYSGSPFVRKTFPNRPISM